MGHFVRTAVEVIGIAVAVAAAIPSGGTSLLGAALSVSASTASLVALGTEVAVAGIGALTAKKPGPAVGNPMEWQSNPQAGLPHIMGRMYYGGQITYRQTWAKSNANETIQTIYSTGPIKGFEGLYVSGVLTSVTGNLANIIDRGKMYVSTQRGAQPEPKQLGDLGPPNYTAASKLSGLAASSITFVYDASGKSTFTTEPQVGYVVLGTAVYDPRKDSTYPGGNGPQRWNDETTWDYAGYDNPGLKALSYLIGYRQGGKLSIGVGLSIGAIVVSQFVEMANVCDANGWTLGGVILSTDDKWQRFNDILQAGGAAPLRTGTMTGCLVNAPKVSLATFQIDDIIGDWSIQATQSRRARINGIVPSYMAEQTVTNQTQDKNGNTTLQNVVTWGIADAGAIVINDYVAFDGGQRLKGVTYPFVTGVSQNNQAPKQVAQLARYDIENAREFGPIKLPMKPRWMGYRAGDVITGGATLGELGLVGQDIMLLNRQFAPASMTVTMTARSETAGKHPFALGQTTTAPPTPALSGPPVVPVPGPNAWAITATAVAANGTTIPALVVGGAVDSPGLDAVVVEYRKAVNGQGADAGWQLGAILPPPATTYAITGVQDGTDYQVSATYRVGQNIGGRLILGPATAGRTSVPWATGVTGPAKPADYATNSGDPNSPFGNANVTGPFNSGTVGWALSRVYTLEQITGSGGQIDQRFQQLQNEVDQAGNGATDPRTDVLVRQATELEASARGAGVTSPNQLINPTFADGLNSWSASNGSWYVIGGFDSSPFVQSASPNAYLFQDVPVGGGNFYSLSADMAPDSQNGGYVKVDWLDQNHGFISTGAVQIFGNGWSRAYTADNALQAPSRAAYARVYCVVNQGASGNARFRQLQFQPGGKPTPFRDDGTVNYNASRITTEIALRTNQAGTYAQQITALQSQFAGNQDSWLKSQITSTQGTLATTSQTLSTRIDTLSSSISSLNSPNLLANGGFANGLSGWSTFGGANWQVVSQYNPIFAQSNYNGGGIYTDVQKIVPGKNYCFGFESACDGGDNQVYMAVQWWGPNGGTGQQVSSAIGGHDGWGVRVTAGPFQAPSGTTYARVVIYATGNGGGNRRVTYLQFQQSDKPTAYSDASSLQAVQAQVTQQAGTIADLQGKAQAYYSVTANAGGATAFVTLNASVNGQVTSDVAIGAKSIALYNQAGNNYLKTIVVENGNVSIYGNLMVAGSVTTMNLAPNSVSNRILLSGGSQTWTGNGSGAGYTPPSGGGGGGGRTSQP